MVVRIPIKMHLLKYLRNKVGADKLEIKHYNQTEMFAEESDVIYIQRELSKTIYPFLNTKIHWHQKQLDKQGNFGVVALNLKDYLVNSKRLCISIEGVKKFNSCIDSIMLKELITITDKAIAENQRQDNAIIDFMTRYQIDEDDIRFDSLKKRCYRERVKFAEKIFLSKNVNNKVGVLDLSFSTKFIQS